MFSKTHLLAILNLHIVADIAGPSRNQPIYPRYPSQSDEARLSASGELGLLHHEQLYIVKVKEGWICQDNQQMEYLAGLDPYCLVNTTHPGAVDCSRKHNTVCGSGCIRVHKLTPYRWGTQSHESRERVALSFSSTILYTTDLTGALIHGGKYQGSNFGSNFGSEQFRPQSCTPIRHTPTGHPPTRYTPIRCMPMRCPPIRCTPMGYTPMGYTTRL
jgi:hypothetical protein